MHRGVRVAVAWLLLLGGVPLPGARADEEGDPPVQELPPIDIRAPRVHAAPGRDTAPISETAIRRRLPAFDVPAAITVLEGQDLTGRRLARSLPEGLLGVPGVMVQKTAPLQVSPFIRGFTGYNNLLLVDGIRLNHSAFRGGPNQYWSTVDVYTIERLEVVRGPHSVLYGSDAVGGTVNAIPWRRRSFEPGFHANGGLRLRAASAENALATRVQFAGNAHRTGWFGGVTWREYGNIISGAGELPGTGGITERDADLRLDHLLDRCWTVSAAVQHVRQFDAPRTETTIFSVPFRGTAAGSELQRDFDQERDLVYARLAYDSTNARAAIPRGRVTVSWHRHKEVRDRLRTGGRQDLEGFVLEQLGIQAQMESRTAVGHLTYGVDYHQDTVNSFRHDFLGGAFTGSAIQGPVGDNGHYHLFGAYLQDQLRFGRFDVIAGARFTYAAASAGRVDNPAVGGSDPTTPGNVISVERDWTNVVGSLRVQRRINDCWNAYAGLSQAFRAPSLHDLTSLDSTSVVESPSPGLDPENYVSAELGVKTEQRDVSGEAAVWLTRLDNAIIRSPTGVLIGGVPEVRKDNIGDGWAWGFELEIAKRFRRSWIGFATTSWMDAEVKELEAMSGALVTSPLSRMKPFTVGGGVRFEPPGGRGWAQIEALYSAREDRLSLRDMTDTRRIPALGTPSWTLVNIRGGFEIAPGQRLSAALENLLDQDYRMHGSGQNQPGISLVVAFEADM